MQETHHTHFAVSDVCICVFCFDPYQFSAGFVYFASLVGSLEWGELKRGGAGEEVQKESDLALPALFLSVLPHAAAAVAATSINTSINTRSQMEIILSPCRCLYILMSVFIQPHSEKRAP